MPTSSRFPVPHVVTPVPDPTELTRRLVDHEIEMLDNKLSIRLDGMDRAASVLAETVNRVPTTLDREISKISALSNEKFSSVATQFAERDVRSKAAELAAQVAVGAALQAQKEAAAAQNDSNAAAITKSEAGTAKQLDGINALLVSNGNALNDKISAITARLDRGEGSVHAKEDSRANSRLDTGTIIAFCALVITLVFGVLTYTAGNHNSPPRIDITPPATISGK